MRCTELSLTGFPSDQLVVGTTAPRNPITGEQPPHTTRFFADAHHGGPAGASSARAGGAHDSSRSYGGGEYVGETLEKDARLLGMATALASRERHLVARARALDAREMQLSALQDILSAQAESKGASAAPEESEQRLASSSVMPREALARLRDAIAESDKARGEAKAAKAAHRQLQVQNQQLVMAATAAAAAEKRASDALADSTREMSKMQAAANALSRALETTRGAEARLTREVEAISGANVALRDRERSLEEQLAGYRDKAHDLSARLAAVEAAATAEALAHENDPNNPRNKLFRTQQEAGELKTLLANKVEALRTADEEKDALKVAVANGLREVWQTKGALMAAQAETSRLLAESAEHQDAERRRQQEEAVARAKREKEEVARALREKELAEKRRRQAMAVFEEVPAQDLAAERARYEDAMARMRALRETHARAKAELESVIKTLTEQVKAGEATSRRLAADRAQREAELGFFRRRLSELIRVSHMQAFYNRSVATAGGPPSSLGLDATRELASAGSTSRSGVPAGVDGLLTSQLRSGQGERAATAGTAINLAAALNPRYLGGTSSFEPSRGGGEFTFEPHAPLGSLFPGTPGFRPLAPPGSAGKENAGSVFRVGGAPLGLEKSFEGLDGSHLGAVASELATREALGRRSVGGQAWGLETLGFATEFQPQLRQG